MPDKLTQNELYQFLIKIILPAFCAVGLKIAVEMKRNNSKTTALNVLLSMVIGIFGAYIASDWVKTSFSEDHISIVIALIAILSDKIGEFVIYKFSIDAVLSGFLDSFFDYILKFKSKK